MRVLEQAIGREIFVHFGIAELRVATAAAGAADAALAVDDDVRGVDDLMCCQGRERGEGGGGVAAGVGDAGGGFDFVGPDVGEAIGPAILKSMIASDVDDARGGGDAAEGVPRFAGGEGSEEDVELGEIRGVPLLDDQVAERGGDAGEAFAELGAGAGFAGDVGQLELRVGGAEAQGLAAAVAADTDDSDSNAHAPLSCKNLFLGGLFASYNNTNDVEHRSPAARAVEAGRSWG